MRLKSQPIKKHDENFRIILNTNLHRLRILMKRNIYRIRNEFYTNIGSIFKTG